LTMKLSLFGPEFSGPDGNARTVATFREALERVSSLPGVKTAGLGSQLPLRWGFDIDGVAKKDKPPPQPEEATTTLQYGVTTGYLEAVGITLLRGRSVTSADNEKAQPVVVINELFARSVWPGEEPIGKLVQLGGPDKPWRMVVGVVGNTHHEGLDVQEKRQL